MSTGERIFALLDSRGIEQKEFGSFLGIDPAVVSKWRKGKSTSYQKILPQIAEYLGTTVDYLLTGTEKGNPTTVSDDEAALNAELISRLCQLSPEELARVDAFVQGLLASR